MERKSIQLDASFESLDEMLHWLHRAGKHGIFVRCLEPVGPAGGNPLMELSFDDRDQLVEFFTDFHGIDPSDLASLGLSDGLGMSVSAPLGEAVPAMEASASAEDIQRGILLLARFATLGGLQGRKANDPDGGILERIEELLEQAKDEASQLDPATFQTASVQREPHVVERRIGAAIATLIMRVRDDEAHQANGDARSEDRERILGAVRDLLRHVDQPIDPDRIEI